jgi:hypothetical protein
LTSCAPDDAHAAGADELEQVIAPELDPVLGLEQRAGDLRARDLADQLVALGAIAEVLRFALGARQLGRRPGRREAGRRHRGPRQADVLLVGIAPGHPGTRISQVGIATTPGDHHADRVDPDAEVVRKATVNQGRSDANA